MSCVSIYPNCALQTPNSLCQSLYLQLLCERRAAFMDLAIANCFDVLADEELDADSKLLSDATTPLPDAKKKIMKQQQRKVDAKKKRETKPDSATMRAKPIVGYNRVMVRETEIRKPKQDLKFDAMQNQQTVVERKILSLKEYEKELLEKKKILNAVLIKRSEDHEEEKASLDKDLELMKVIGKKKKDDHVLFIKPKSDKKKYGETKVYKLVDLRPLRSERSFAAANGRGKFSGRFSEQEVAVVAEHGGRKNADLTLNIEDHSQFPALK